ncbi:uncharacterized protein FMAN_09919 [Fusarium mangiferae]|uniref:Zn(2)-C6 fungal-type domain-containing protein n=1 Tax=Fusarium mangiferae TaxID=192010 RepID=A0A1L7TXQ6_FUSMA|nr:uncharacterized protein FMAN_09919 [Fusarium mangiferae]CVL00495.1 uncharacterized protein FMAN_09919 [Fusarium mangiferae]
MTLWVVPITRRAKTAVNKLCLTLGYRDGAQDFIRTFARTQDQADSQGSSKITTGMRTVQSQAECKNCTKLGSKCPGFEAKLRWSRKHERARTTSHPEVTTSEQDRSRLPPSTSQAIEMMLSTELPTNVDVAMNEFADISIDPNLSWLTEGPSTWEPTEFGGDTQHIDDTAWDSLHDGELIPTSSLQYDLSCPSNQGIPKAPVHLPTTLIEHWFRFICPMRSTFDSEINYNRQLAWSSWSTSETVFYMMQVMSAACLMTTMPQLRDTLPSLKQQATLAINHAISQVRASLPTKVTSDLVFAVFGLGTSSHWIVTTFPAQQPWLESARELLFMWKLNLAPGDALIHAYFCQALTYWEMLVAAIGRGSMPVKVDQRRKKYHSRLRKAMNLQTTVSDAMCEVETCYDSGPNPFGTRPNSWCGLSNEVISVFGQVLALCRSVCYRDKKNVTLTLETTSNALCDISVALELQRELLAMDFKTLVLLEEAQGYSVETRDNKTPLSHLFQTAEAYRQAALLQLYLTFHDLDTKHKEGQDNSLLANTSPDNAVNVTSGDKTYRARFLASFTLQLVAILEKIPAESGSKFIHPMLYLSAAAGLRFSHLGSQDGSRVENWASFDLTQSASCLLPDLSLDTTNPALASYASIPQLALELSQARCLVWARLGNIQQALPYRASDSICQLVKTIWSEYDNSQPGSTDIHWLEVLRRTGLEMPG